MSCPDLSRVVSQTVEILANEAVWERECGSYGYGEGVHGSLSRKLDQIITLIDEGLFNRERDLEFASPVYDDDYYQAVPGFRKSKHMQNAAEYFSKVYLYYNSRLPAQLPPLKLIYTPTYTLLRLAARYSRQVYQKPIGPERQCYIDADWRQGTKAMVIKSIPLDHRNAIVFAIRGTQSFRDWTINLKTDPKSPEGLLDDPDNLCHAGFLSVARKMVGPVAARLRSLLAEDPNRVAHSLIITGHSAGGAVASLLFCHMLSEYVQSELTHLRPFFKRVHCVTFGSPPVSIRPLQLPQWNARSPKRSMFFSFINEGDPVPRAEKAYLRSLLDLYVSPTKAQGESRNWKVPRATLSAAGRLVLLRRKQLVMYPSLPVSEGVEASIITHGQLREVVFGDPLMHTMDLYAKRIEELARNAVHYSVYSP
ncbi:lipase family protein [Aspergillus ruber CBS 135680]|uniref:Alpha/beta-hydrolase n=1 Tax=Aspergillus ruber (strain CBS 135680) TaxID=1388766 RepID=A0A017SNV8_ASPRC|nr:alpha/beta-hydrolase [Aspergillus ruber CBS 135680]EYE98314.1 alpha/beta-hydrolase [Aspergillus ruber CBS 135680]